MYHVEWRIISWDHLRLHPSVIPLPCPEDIIELQCLDDVRQFRQGSHQWEVLHHGQLTTSQAAAALGFLENECGELLNVPKTWRRGGIGAYTRLHEPALRTLEDINKMLCEMPREAAIAETTTR
jgi:hypothetical protein